MSEVEKVVALSTFRACARQEGRTSGVRVDDVRLDYPVNRDQGSLKASLFSLLGLGKKERKSLQTVRALDGVSFTLAHGEKVGVIGTNGSGKSSLLRALAGIYPLKSGTIELEGEVGTLLEIGLGFETEATGRENIYNRGMAMGLSPKLLREYEADIVAFADLGEFIDMPMRTYSMGMYVRLGFAISTQFAPDVLLIDEIFGAGDVSFAHRAKARMRSIVDNSGALVLVSHDLDLVKSMCERVIWLSKGMIVMDGPSDVVVEAYIQAYLNAAHAESSRLAEG